SLVAHLSGGQVVGGSNPATPTNFAGPAQGPEGPRRAAGAVRERPRRRPLERRNGGSPGGPGAATGSPQENRPGRAPDRPGIFSCFPSLRRPASPQVERGPYRPTRASRRPLLRCADRMLAATSGNTSATGRVSG